tara:strand:- start:554 stop:748 length:195 start_codon:yes stop_codon:yes gene_type:complete
MEIDPILYKKMLFIYKSLNKGWTISKTGEIYTLSKKHNNKRKYYKKSYLHNFMQKNLETDIIKQ